MQPLFNFQGSTAPLSVLAFLGTGAVLAGLGIAFVVLALRREWFAAKRVAIAGGGVAGAYLLMLAALSLTARAETVEPGNAKYFCELDCHLAYSVAGARRLAAIGGTRANGAFEIVTLRVWFDPRTISAERGDGPLTPNPRFVRVVDARGTQYRPSDAGMRALAAAEGAQTPLTQALRPGESYTTSLVFDVPANVSEPRLLLTEDDLATLLLIGHENSILHPRVLFRLADSSSSAGAPRLHG